MFNILEIECSDAAMALFIVIIKRGFAILQVIVPIILISMTGSAFSQLMINPDDENRKKVQKTIMNRFAAAIIVFFLPYLISLVISWIPEDTFEFNTCWNTDDSKGNIISWPSQSETGSKTSTTETQTSGGGSTTHEVETSEGTVTHGGTSGGF